MDGNVRYGLVDVYYYYASGIVVSSSEPAILIPIAY